MYGNVQSELGEMRGAMVNYDPIAADYARHRRADPEVLQVLASKLTPASAVLEIGCGTGNYIVTLQAAVGCSCWGIDPSMEMLASAKKRSGTIPFQLGRAESLDFPAESFDLVFSVDVIHHVADRQVFFQEAYRVLRAGGRICTVTESAGMIRQRLHALYFPETVAVELGRYPSVTVLRELMEEAGFRQLAEASVEFTSSLTDITAYREKAFSSLHLISPQAFQQGIDQMEQDLRGGPISSMSRHLVLSGTK
jgi:ubiquinone/menaquinone biosynthesis C-methylase UbiE